MAALDDEEVSRVLRDAVERVSLLPRCREGRAFAAAGERLANALRTPRPTALLDAGARADVSHAVRDVRDVIARCTAANSPRVALLNSDPERKTRRFRVSARATLRGVDRKALDAAAKRVEATAQVALYKARTATATQGAANANSASGGAVPTNNPSINDPADRFDAEVSRREWEFSLVKAPITPLSARDMDRAPHGALLPALWRGARVSVRVMRRDRARFYAEGDYLWRLGDSPCVPKLLGGHWSSASVGRPSATDVGYLVIEVVTGTSLDKLVRQQRLAATLNQLRVLDRIVTALLHAQNVVPALSHQDLHPGNIFLVPTNASSPLSCTLTPPVGPATTPVSSAAGGSPLPATTSVPQPNKRRSNNPPQTTPVVDGDDDEGASVGSANSITVNEAPVLNETGTPIPSARGVPALETTTASDDDGANAEPGSPVRSDTTLDARVRRAASTAAARGDVALARGMLSMHSIQTRMRAAGTAGSTNGPNGSTQSLSQRTAGALLGATAKRTRPPAAYLVKVLDFAPSSEALGRRARTSWSNPTVAGYCAPEMATPRMWRRAGDHRQRHNISALRHDSMGRKSSDSSNTTLSAVVHTPNIQRPASPIAGKNQSNMSRSLSYPRKPAAPVDTAEHVMFDDNLNNDLDVLAPPFGRVHSLDSARLVDEASAQPRKMMTHHAAYSTNNKIRPQRSVDSAHRSTVPSVLPDDDEPRDLNKLQDRPEPPKKSDRSAEPRRMASLYRRISAHRSRSSELLVDKVEDPGAKTHLTGNILGAVLSRTSGGARVFEADGLPAVPNLNGHTPSSLEPSERASAIAKVDVWSLGWLLYYMASGEHPPSDAWASTRPLAAVDLNSVAPQIADVMRFCIVHDVARRASLSELKKRLESHMRHAVFAKGLSLLDTNPRHAFKLLDKVVGIRVPSASGTITDDITVSECALDEHTEDTVELAVALQRRANSANPNDSKRPRPRISGGYTRLQSSFSENVPEVRAQSLAAGGRAMQIPSAVGLNPRTRAALSTLPLVIVRRVEWEFAARKYECPARDLQRLRRALITERWTKSEVADGELAIAYLRRRCAQGVTSAQSALGWVYRWGAGGAPKDVSRAIRLWEEAMNSADPEAANGLGLIFHHGRRDIRADGRRAQRYYEAAVEQGYPAAAVNLGVMLHDGAAGLPNDGLSAKALYELASQHGDAIAANNLGLLFQHGAPGVDREPAKAVHAYELAIARGERNHARRNLAELLFDGAHDVKRNVHRAIDMLVRAVDEGDQPSRQAAQAKIRALVARDKDAVRAALPKAARIRINDLIAV